MSFKGRVEVFSASQVAAAPTGRGPTDTSLDVQDASSNLDSIHHLFASPDMNDEAQVRAQKRRKIDHYRTTSSRPAEFVERKTIELAKVTLELVSAYANLVWRSRTDSKDI
jgi:hypothetical protein